jgi:hypothetical protein
MWNPLQGRSWYSFFDFLLRWFQFTFGLIAMACVAGAFRNIPVQVAGIDANLTNMLGSHETRYALLTTLVSWLFPLWYMLSTLLGWHVLPRQSFQRLIDLIFSIMLLVAGIVMANSDFVRHCFVYNQSESFLKCSVLKVATVFTFLTFFTYLWSFLLSFFCEEAQPEEKTISGQNEEGASGTEGPAGAPYIAGVTPTARRGQEEGTEDTSMTSKV